MIDGGRFTGIGPADDRDTDRALGDFLVGQLAKCFRLLVLFGRFGQQLAHRVIEFTHALAVLGGDHHRIAEPERIGLHGADLALFALALIGEQDHRLVGAAREIGKGAVVRRQAGAGVDHEKQRVGEFDRRLGLLLHARGQRAPRALIEPRGIDDGEAQVAEPGLALAAVTGHARGVVDQRELLPDQTVEQGRLADIGPADDCKRIGHRRSVA